MPVLGLPTLVVLPYACTAARTHPEIVDEALPRAPHGAGDARRGRVPSAGGHCGALPCRFRSLSCFPVP